MPGEPRRRRGCLFKGLVAAGVLVGLIVIVVGVLVWYTRSHQEVELPADGTPLQTAPPMTLLDQPAAFTSAFVQQGLNRREIAYVMPPDLAPGEQLPVVLFLHGVSTSPGLMQQTIGLGDAVVARRFIAVVPHGIAESWNAGKCCRPSMTLGIDDVAFLDAVITDAIRRPEIDAERVFMVGESNGGIMTYRYLCEHADRLAGAASVIGTNQTGCLPSEPLPLLHIAASADEVIPYDGGTSSAARLFSAAPFPPVMDTLRAIAESESCTPDPATVPEGPVEVTEWQGCRDEVPLRLVTVIGATHLWPRGDQFKATDAVLDFFGLAPS